MMEEILNQVQQYWVILVFIGTGIGTMIRTNITTKHRLTALEKHANDKELHWSLEKKVDYFMPRKEIDLRIENIERILYKIEKKMSSK